MWFNADAVLARRASRAGSGATSCVVGRFLRFLLLWGCCFCVVSQNFAFRGGLRKLNEEIFNFQ